MGDFNVFPDFTARAVPGTLSRPYSFGNSGIADATENDTELVTQFACTPDWPSSFLRCLTSSLFFALLFAGSKRRAVGGMMRARLPGLLTFAALAVTGLTAQTPQLCLSGIASSNGHRVYARFYIDPSTGVRLDATSTSYTLNETNYFEVLLDGQTWRSAGGGGLFIGHNHPIGVFEMLVDQIDTNFDGYPTGDRSMVPTTPSGLWNFDVVWNTPTVLSSPSLPVSSSTAFPPTFTQIAGLTDFDQGFGVTLDSFDCGPIAPPVQILTKTLNDATSGKAYTATLTASPGIGITWSKVAGQLPEGFTLSTDGILSSTGNPPATAKTWEFTVQAKDLYGNTAPQSLSLVVQPRPPGTITLLDPAPYLLSFTPYPGGPPFLGDAVALDDLVGLGNAVEGVAADGTTEIIVQVDGALPNERLTIAIDGDGQLASVGSTAFQPTPLSVQADSKGKVFALYRAPDDFVGPGGADSEWATRNVNVKVRSVDDNTFTADRRLLIARPLVMLIHGLWSNPADTWGKFLPLTPGLPTSDSRFQVATAKYDMPVSVVSSLPVRVGLDAPKANSLGLSFTTPIVLAQLQQELARFRKGNNPAYLPLAATQADIVAHSMGGLIARNLELQPGVTGPSTFGQGLIHKLITIDTPHLGTPVAIDLLSEDNSCVRNVLERMGLYSFLSVQVSAPIPYNGAGAAGDLMGPGNTSHPELLSAAIKTLRAAPGSGIYTALIAGTTDMNNLNGLDGLTSNARGIRVLCALHGDPLASSLTSSGWSSVFSGEANDGVVSLTSQLDGQTAVPLLQFSGRIHSAGFEVAGFAAPTMLDQGFSPAMPNYSPVPSTVIYLLNTPRTDTTLYKRLTQ